MLSSFLSWWVGRVISRMKFPHQAEGGRSISDSVLNLFRRGCEMGLKGYSGEAFMEETQTVPWNLRAFFNEGHAMGSAGRAACSLRSHPPEGLITSKNYEVMHFVGYGFWNGAAATYPVPSISEAASYWKEVPTFPRYHLLMANGCGFALVLFRGRFDHKLKQQLVQITDAGRREAVYHGVGRVLWFLYLNNF